MTLLNLGAGKKIKPNCINIDIAQMNGIDEVKDLSIFPWKWEDNSIDGIYMSHFLEHFPDQKQVLSECLRILRPGGFLNIVGPHASCIPSVGCLGHYRTYSYSTFNDYLAEDWYMFGKAKFKTIKQELRWWYEVSGDNVPDAIKFFIIPFDFIINKLIALSPRLFENLWWPIVGGAREVEWEGIKL